jgi:hypothetical protein
MAKKTASKYKEEFCDQLIAHMSEGLSYACFAGRVGVSRDTLYEWEKKHKEWVEAKRMGEMQSLLMWEQLGIDLARGTSRGNVISWIFNMKNRFREDWKDTQVVETKEDVNNTITIAYPSKLPNPNENEEKKD